MALDAAPAAMADDKYYVILTRKRYHEYESELARELGAEAAATAMAVMRRTFAFDPSKSRYTPELGKQQAERRRRAAAEHGLSVRQYLQARKEGRV